MKIRSVTNNNRKKALEIATAGAKMQFPHAKLQPRPSAADPMLECFHVHRAMMPLGRRTWRELPARAPLS